MRGSYDPSGCAVADDKREDNFDRGPLVGESNKVACCGWRMQAGPRIRSTEVEILEV